MIKFIQGVGVAKSNNKKEYMVCHYWFFNHGLKIQDSVCNGCHYLTMLCLNISDITITTAKGVLFMALANLNQFIYQKILCMMIVGIYKMYMKQKNYKGLVIYFTRYVPNKLMKILRWHYD